MKEKKEIVTQKIRIDNDIYSYIEGEARDNKRSIRVQIIYMLKSYWINDKVAKS